MEDSNGTALKIEGNSAARNKLDRRRLNKYKYWHIKVWKLSFGRQVLLRLMSF